MNRLILRHSLATCLLVGVAASTAVAAPSFVLTFDPAVRNEPFSGRVYVFFSQNGEEPRRGPDWFNPQPFIAKDVEHWKPGEPLTLSPNDKALLSFPKPLEQLELTGFNAQPVARFSPWEREVGSGPGNGFGSVAKVPEGDASVPLAIDRLVKARPYQETKWNKLIEVPSKRLSEFYGHDVSLRGTVILPASYYEQPDRRYPTIFTIPGFGGDHRVDPMHEPIPEQNAQGVEFFRVMLDPSAPLGHHVFADSANNGPVGTAFVEEFLPEFDKQYRSIPEPSARFLTGHSSGGWSSLWLQISHPDDFGGVWSTSPDPVDFRDFQRIDIYRPGENMYVDQSGKPRPLARLDGEVALLYRKFDAMEQVLGPGGQLHSFEAVFSPRGENGKPLPLWDRKTGAIDPAVAEAWKKYDIRCVLEEHWPELRDRLAGKLHLIMGAEDTFYLEGAVRLLKQSLEKLGSDAVVEIVPGRNHFDLLSPDLRARIRKEMTAEFLKHHEWK
jgi:S-formylglutathione hydrolase FrmB